MTETISGILTDYAVMTEGEHAGRYGARINDTPYPVMPHVDAFLTRLQKNVPVEVHLNKDGWISKITPAKKSPVPAAKKAEPTAQDIDQEKAEYNAKAADEARNLERKRKEQETLAEKLAKAGFEQPAKAQAPLVDAEKPLPKPQQVTQIATYPPLLPAIRYNEDQMSLMRAKVAPNCTQTEFELLMYMANKYNLDPLIRQIWAIKYEGKPALIFAGRDGFLEIAHRSGHFDGMKSDCVYDDKGVLVSAWCEIWRNDMTHSFRSSVLLSEYTTGMNLWKSKPSVMLIKCAESVCLRKAFSVSGLYAPEEVGE